MSDSRSTPPARSECDGLPEVGDLVERPAGVDEVCWPSLVVVGDEAGIDHLDVGDPRLGDFRPKLVEHHLRHINRDHPVADAGGRHRELTSARPEIHDVLRLIEAHLDEKLDFLRCPGILLAVALAGMDRIEVLPTRGSQLIEHPAWLARHLAPLGHQRRFSRPITRRVICSSASLGRCRR